VGTIPGAAEREEEGRCRKKKEEKEDALEVLRKI